MKWQEKDIMIKMRNVRTIERTFRLYRKADCAAKYNLGLFKVEADMD